MPFLCSILLQIPTEPATPLAAVDFTWLFVKMLLVLGIVTVAAILILKYAVPKMGVMKRFQLGGYFEVKGRYMLEPKKTLYLVRACNRYLVLGVSDHAINLVTEIGRGEMVAEEKNNA